MAEEIACETCLLSPDCARKMAFSSTLSTAAGVTRRNGCEGR